MKVPCGTFEETVDPLIAQGFVPRQGLWVPAVFGPYEGTIPFPALGDKTDDYESSDEYDRKAGDELEEVDEVIHW